MKTWQKRALVVIVILGLIICFKSCIDKEDADINIAYIGNNFVNRTLFKENKSALENVCEDVSSDGKQVVDLMEISFNEEMGYADQQNSSQKMANAIGLGAARVYILTEPYVIINSAYDVFEDLSCFGDGFKNSNGQVVAISLEGNEKVKNLGFPQNERLYLAVRKVTEMDTVSDKNIVKKHNSAMKIAEYILN